jgi:hypothetical protein
MHETRRHALLDAPSPPVRLIVVVALVLLRLTLQPSRTTLHHEARQLLLRHELKILQPVGCLYSTRSVGLPSAWSSHGIKAFAA